MRVILVFAAAFFMIAVFAVVFGAIFAFPVKWLFNYVGPSVFGLREIDFWQAWALLALCGILFKNSASAEKKGP